MIEVEISTKAAATKALVPVGLLRRYLEAQEVEGRELLVFDSDEEVSSEVAASMLGVSRPHLNELLDIESIPYRRVGNQRRIRVADIAAFRERRDRAEKQGYGRWRRSQMSPSLRLDSLTLSERIGIGVCLTPRFSTRS